MNPQETARADGISVVIPAFNEGLGIGDVLAQLLRTLDATGLPHEVVVVDDGSRDATAEVARRYAGVTVLTHATNRGYGAALKTGIRHARYEIVAISDADGTYPIDMLPELIDRLVKNAFDMVVGARTGRHVEIPLIRRAPKWVIRRLAVFVTGAAIPDLNSGLRVFRRSAVLRLFPMLPDGFSLTSTITVAMLTNGYLVEFVPIDYRRRVGRSKIRPIHDTLNFVQLVLRMTLYFAPLKIFIPLSLSLLGLAAGWALFSKVVFGQLADVSTLILASAGLQMAAIGMLAELINQRMPGYGKESQ